MKRLPLSRLEALEATRADKRRIRLLFVEARATAADIERQRDTLIAEGKASADDRFIAFCWRDD